MARIPTIETIGAIVRTEFGYLARIVGVAEFTRMSASHITSPCDVVVELEPVGVAYRQSTAWASSLAPAQDGDIGSHPHLEGQCPCGQRYQGVQAHMSQHMPATWQDTPAWIERGCVDPEDTAHEHCPEHGCVEYLCCMPANAV